MRPIRRACLAVTVAAAMGVLVPSLALAKVRIAVDLDTQTMHVEAHGETYEWKVSSGKPGYETPAGQFKVLWMDKDHHSDTYEQAWMPNAIFFAPGYAIHGFAKSPWGHKASHGCIRLPAPKAAMLFDLVKAEGAEITVTGYSPVTAPTVAQAEAAHAAKTRQGTAADGTAADGAAVADALDAPGGRGRYAPDARGYDARGYDGRGYDGRGYEEAPYAPARAPARREDSIFGGFY